jgi:hypothetical protein
MKKKISCFPFPMGKNNFLKTFINRYAIEIKVETVLSIGLLKGEKPFDRAD